MTERRVPHLLDPDANANDASEILRAALRGARADVPDASHMDVLSRSIGAAISGAGAGTGGDSNGGDGAAGDAGAGDAGAGTTGSGSSAGSGASTGPPTATGAGASAGVNAAGPGASAAGAGAVGAGAAGAAASGGLKLALGAAVALGAVGVAVLVAQPTRERAMESTRSATSAAPPPSSGSSASAVASNAASGAEQVVDVHALPSAQRGAPLPETKDISPKGIAAEPQSPAAEMLLLRAAQGALAGSPEEALARCDEHAKRFPTGALAEEREVLAVDALLRLDRRADAEARATRFRSAHPRSAYLRRLETLLGAPP